MARGSTRRPDRLARASRLVAAIALVVLGTAGCSIASPDGPGQTMPPTTPALAWREVSLPSPPGAAGRLAIRDATTCAGRWFVVGAVVGADGESRPAAWASADGTSWTPLPIEPSGYWAQRDVLHSIACQEATGEVAMVGAKPGGGHGNPRVSTWYARPDGTFVDADAAFELYGGPKAVNVGRIAANADGWLISGNRTNGGAIWRSADGVDFELDDDAPGLSDDAAADTVARDAVYDDGWTMVGSATLPGQAGWTPMAWSSSDGSTWQRVVLPAEAGGYRELQRVAAFGDELLAVGVDQNAFDAVQVHGGAWADPVRFGSFADGGTQPSAVTGLTVAAGTALVTATDGADYHLWASRDGAHWQEAPMPAVVHPGGDQWATVVAGGAQAADPGAVLLLTDDGSGSRLFLADLGG